MSSSTVNRKVYVSVSTMVATLLLLIGSFVVSRSASDSTVFADQATTDSTVVPPRTTVPASTIPEVTTVAASTQKFSALPAKSEFPSMESTTEQELLAGIPNDGKSWIVIPRLHLRMQIVSGISDDRLALGVGWYRRSPKPGSKGNIGLAGHRTTFPAPFYFLDKMRIADSVILIVGNELHRYLVKANEVGEPYDVVQPDNIGVLAYLGFDSVTLTTCTPIGTVKERLIVHAKLMKRIPFERKD
jgi:sortase A